VKRFFSSLYLLILGGILFLITLDSCIGFMKEAEQKLRMPLGQNIAKDFAPYLQNGIDHLAIEQTIHGMMVVNPNIEIYLLDETGNILAFFAEAAKAVPQRLINIEPIEKFLKNEEKRSFKGDDPRHPGRQKIFSAASVNIGKNRKGYVYVILGGEKYDSALAAVMNSHIGRSAVLVLLMAILATAIAGLVFFFYLTRRFRRITKSLHKFERGDLNERIPVESQDEIGYLARAFNRMAETLMKNIEDMKNKERLRRDLIANISHDLRSPLTSLQGYLETILIKEKSLPEEERRRLMETIFKNATQLNKLVSQLFELSKLDAKEIRPKPEPFSLPELVQDALLKFKHRAEQQRISFKTAIPATVPLVYGDIGMIERAISNLIDNALSYTAPDGDIKISLTPHHEKIVVSVSDTGSGIPSEDIPFVFDRFYRVDKSRTRVSNSGAGLGLAITKKIIEAHDSLITVNSILNQGTTFEFELPLHGSPPYPG
jgi:signal transduction histidine kinase